MIFLINLFNLILNITNGLFVINILTAFFIQLILFYTTISKTYV